MLRKLSGYVFLSLASFCCFTLVFHSAASAQTGIFTPKPTSTPLLKQQTLVSLTNPTSTPSPLPSVTLTPTTLPTEAPSPTNTPQPTATPTVQVTPTQTPTPTPQTNSSDLESMFTQYADEYHVNKDQLKKIAQCESSFNPQATNGEYTGMYQFAAASWESARRAMNLDSNPELRKDAGESIRTAAYMLSIGQENAWMNCK